MPRRHHALVLRATGITAGLLLVPGLASCSFFAEQASPEPTASVSTSATPSAEPAPTGPVLVPDGTAEDNLPLFAAVTAQVWGGADKVHGRAYIDALVAAGFDKADMQVTDDESTVGRAAESIQFSVRWGNDQCLIGQVGPSTGTPVTAVMPQLAEGRCLVGNTRPIDW